MKLFHNKLLDMAGFPYAVFPGLMHSECRSYLSRKVWEVQLILKTETRLKEHISFLSVCV